MSYWSFVFGTRPEIIKLAPLIRRSDALGVPFQLVHTGQHYDHLMDGIFFDQLNLPPPDVRLDAARPTQGEFFGAAFPALEKLWMEKKPAVVIVQGDTNSAFAGAFVAHRLGIPVAHIEAGLRSDDWSMPEEANRVLIDRLSARHYAPTERHIHRMHQEGIDEGKAVLTGNTVADAVSEHVILSKDVSLPEDIVSFVEKDYVLITLHRPALVDHPDRFASVLAAIEEALAKHQLQGIFPVHPRTRRAIGDDMRYEHIHFTDPFGYLLMLRLLSAAKVIITDSGGLQEESSLLQIPCITVRENTERPETVEAGGNVVVGFDPVRIQEALHTFLSSDVSWKPLYSVEHPSDIIIKDLLSQFPCASS